LKWPVGVRIQSPVMRALLDAGAEVDAPTTIKETPLHVAARMSGRVDVLRFLAAYGADVNARDDDGWTPLHGAANLGSVAAILALAELGAEIDARDNLEETPFLLAVRANENPAAAIALINLGADVNAADKRGWTALHITAARAEDPRSLDDWIEAGAEVEARTVIGETPLHVAARLNPSAAVIEHLVKDLGANLEARDGDGWTPFLGAARAGLVENVTALAALGASLNARDKLGQNAMHLAARYNEDEETAWELLDLGVEPAVQDLSGAYPWNLLLKNPNLADSDLVDAVYPIGAHPEKR
jgi:cytohesin